MLGSEIVVIFTAYQVPELRDQLIVGPMSQQANSRPDQVLLGRRGRERHAPFVYGEADSRWIVERHDALLVDHRLYQGVPGRCSVTCRGARRRQRDRLVDVVTDDGEPSLASRTNLLSRASSSRLRKGSETSAEHAR